MAGFIDIDDSELRNLEVDLAGAPIRAQLGRTRVVKRGLTYLEQAMRGDAAGHRHLAQLPKAVSSEMLTDDMGEAGLSPGGQGSLAHIIVYGSVNNGPVYDHMSGPRRVIPKILDDTADMGEDAVLGGDGSARR